MNSITEDTIRNINAGSQEAFETLYNTYYAYLCVVAIKYTYDIEIARELVNDIFVNIWKNHPSLTYPVLPYLVKSIKNRSLNYLKRTHLNTISLSDSDNYLYDLREDLIRSDVHPLRILLDKEINEQIEKAINGLPPKCKRIFIEYLYENKTYEEIAQSMNISTSTVRVQIKIGLTKLRCSLQNPHLFIFLSLLFIKR